MPWKESRIVDQRLQFLSSYQKEEMSVSDLWREFGVSRPTGYRWINRYKEVGPEGLLDLSSRPHSCSHASPLNLKAPTWGWRSAIPSWNRMVAVCGPHHTTDEARRFISLCQPQSWKCLRQCDSEFLRACDSRIGALFVNVDLR